MILVSCPTEGRARGRSSVRGSRRSAPEIRRKALGVCRVKLRRIDAVAVTDATRHRCGGPSRVVPKRRPRFTRDMAARTRAAPYGARKGGPIAVGKLLMTGYAERELETVCPPGVTRSKPQTPRAGRRGARFSAVSYCLCTFTTRAQGRGELALPGVPRALDFLMVQKRRKKTGVPGA